MRLQSVFDAGYSQFMLLLVRLDFSLQVVIFTSVRLGVSRRCFAKSLDVKGT